MNNKLYLKKNRKIFKNKKKVKDRKHVEQFKPLKQTSLPHSMRSVDPQPTHEVDELGQGDDLLFPRCGLQQHLDVLLHQRLAVLRLHLSQRVPCLLDVDRATVVLLQAMEARDHLVGTGKLKHKHT